MSRNLVFIANLSAKNSYNHEEDYEPIISYFKRDQIEVHYHKSVDLADLKTIVYACVQKGYREYIVMGGDGSLHCLINELMALTGEIESFKLGVIPMGTGNDWLKNFNFKNLEDILKTILQGDTMKIDLGRIQFQNSSHEYFMNISGIGFNGEVIQKIDRFKFLGKWAY